ncbi:hypothetical protein DN590_25275 [Citrobacter freundii]|nr:hypothetical protein [Citrobacter youngae]MBJ9603762.1 hypothetical protein [Citrobacter sp. FDAARGOS_156]RWT88093.1 hypothetical protein DN590_25275 [Citrobacter freundii]HAU4281888.1 hypothetical protein [Citrobacter freundii]
MTMYAKSFLACNSAGRLTGARTALRSPEERYNCHHCGSVLVLHAESERPWFAHTDAALTERGRQDCPYIQPDIDEVLLIRQLQRYVPGAMPVTGHAVHHCPVRVCHKAGGNSCL